MPAAGNRAGHPSAREELAARLRAQILAGALPPGAKLAPVRQLAAAHKFSLVTAAHAVDLLASQGYLVCRPRQGVYVSERAQWQPVARRVAVVTGVTMGYAAGVLQNHSYLSGMQTAMQSLVASGHVLSILGCVCYPFGDAVRRAYIPPAEQPGLRDADAVIVAGVYDMAYLGSLLELHKPVIVYDLDASALRMDSVCVDDTGSAFALTRALLRRGCRRVAFLGSVPNTYDRQQHWTYDPCLQRRADGYALAMRTHGLPTREFFVDLDRDERRAAERIFREMPDCDAVVVNGPDLQILKRREVAVARWAARGDKPRRRGLELVAEIDFEAMGRAVLRLLEARLTEATPFARREVLQPEIVCWKHGKRVGMTGRREAEYEAE